MTKEQKEKVKKLLSSYKTMKLQVECIDYEINLIKDLRNTESYIIEKNTEIEYKKVIKKRLEDCINSIDKVLNELSDTERNIVELRYLEGEKHTWDEIGNIVGYSAIYCRKGLFYKCLKILYENIIKKLL
ncbi:sigma factor-like helix-turn-helix DNA-binding protein [Clostridium perfringens]